MDAVRAVVVDAHAFEIKVTFEKDVRPILKAQCFHCHGEDGETKGGLDVRLARSILKGGESGAAVVPGKAAESHLLKMVREGEMPKGKAKLKAEQVETIERWIAQGAKTARPEPEKLGPEHAFTDEERAWWALQPIRKPVRPVGAARVQANPIDDFVAQKQAEKDLAFSPEADPVTLIRRATFDLTGLPPTPEEVDAFVAEHTADARSAMRNLIERLLASPAYGERWGRHWLDIAGYADSDGYTDKDLERKYAYKYRDYVVKSWNADKPFDQFIREQLAGDEMVPQPHKNLSAEAIEKITATGFLRMAADGTGAMNDKIAQNSTIADTLKIVSTAFYGLTIGCAQCHDHRYDPITQEDYYRLRAIFEPGFDTKSWRVPAGRLVSLLTDEDRAKGAEIEVEAKKVDAARLAKQEEFITEVLEKELAKAEEKDREGTAHRLPHGGEGSQAGASEAAEGLSARESTERRIALPLRQHLQDEARRHAEEDDGRRRSRACEKAGGGVSARLPGAAEETGGCACDLPLSSRRHRAAEAGGEAGRSECAGGSAKSGSAREAAEPADDGSPVGLCAVDHRWQTPVAGSRAGESSVDAPFRKGHRELRRAILVSSASDPATLSCSTGWRRVHGKRLEHEAPAPVDDELDHVSSEFAS
jgi:hypothetical protein